MKFFPKLDYRLFCWLIIIAVLGLGTKYYPGPGRAFWNDSLAGCFYVTFWCLFWQLLLPNFKKIKLIFIVLISTSALEFLQLWHPPFLQFIRKFWLGKVIIGTTFTWTDFPYYLLGALIAFLISRRN